MKRCYKCRRQFSDQALIYKNKHKYCHNCFDKYFIQDKDWEFITIGNPDIYECRKCWRVITQQIHEDLDGMCRCCFANKYWTSVNNIIKCLKCWKFHLCNENCECIRQMEFNTSNSFSICNEHTSRNYKWERTRKDINLDTTKIQELLPYDEEVDKYLNMFYHRSDEEFHRYPSRWKDINEEWTITFVNANLIKDVLHALKTDKANKRLKIMGGYEISKYSDMELTWVKDWKLEWTRINLMWKKVSSYESVNKFLTDHDYIESKAQLSWTYKYRMSTDIKHKLIWLQINEKFRSCQHSSNSNSYASWAYDFITNWCNCPILIYKDWVTDPIWRMLCRIMYDKKWIEYIVVERLYHNWEFWSQWWSDSSRWYVIKAIVEDLIKKWYNIVVSPYSAHDESMYAYLITMWMNMWKPIKSLTQPARVMYRSCWYYCDGWTKVQWMEFLQSWVEKIDSMWLNKTGQPLTETFSSITLWIDSLCKWYLLSL